MSTLIPYVTLSGPVNEYVYKKTLGVAYENPGTFAGGETISSLPFIFPSQLFLNAVPIQAPTLNSKSTGKYNNCEFGTINSNILYYFRLPLIPVNPSNNSFVYSTTQSDNILTQVIPSTYDPINASYNIIIEYVDGSDYKPLSSTNATYPWLFDGASGCLSMTLNSWNTSSYGTTPYITFYRYVGPLATNGVGWQVDDSGTISSLNTSSSVSISSDGSFTGTTITGTTITGSTSLVSGSGSISSDGTITGTTIKGTSLSDGTLSISSGNISSADTISCTTLNTSSFSVTGSSFSVNSTGDITCNSVTTSSDYRIKENIQALNSSFNVENLNPVTYKNIKTGKQDIGLIAHDLQKEYPFLVNGEKDGHDLQSVNYLGLIPILIHEIKQLKLRIKELESNVI